MTNRTEMREYFCQVLYVHQISILKVTHDHVSKKVVSLIRYLSFNRFVQS